MSRYFEETFGVGFPLVAFSHCRDVVVAVSKAGGLGVLGAVAYTPDQLEIELSWIDEHIDGHPYGVDVLIPNKLGVDEAAQATDATTLSAQVTPEHEEFVRKLLADHGIEGGGLVNRTGHVKFLHSLAEELLDVAFRHPIKLVANALGVPSDSMLTKAREHGVPVAALVGTKEHAVKQLAAGVDIIVAQGTEAGGHCGEVSTLVLVPEVVRAVNAIRPVPVLAAGGIMTGEQMAACIAMGAAGAWTGSVWLSTPEAETTEIFREKMVEARSSDTVRSRGRTGKPARQLKSDWTRAWEDESAPDPLPMPIQSLLSQPNLDLIDSKTGNGAKALSTYFVGQGVGLVESVKSAKAVVEQFMDEYATAAERLAESVR